MIKIQLFSLLFICILFKNFAQPKNLTGMADPHATFETKQLLINLKKLVETGTMFGHQDDLDYGIGWREEIGRSDVKSVVGDYPAVIGWELGKMELGSPYNLDSVYFEKIKGHITETYKHGGITTISWHATNPLTGGSAWDTSQVVVESILPGGANHEKYKQWLSTLATFFKSLKDSHRTLIPVLFRPLHELSGSWFWWGKNLCTPEQYKELWKLTVTTLRDTEQVHNLLYIYSTDIIKNEHEYMERYPGDDYCDGLGIDIYHRGNNKGTNRYIENLQRCLTIVTKVAKERNKLSALTETGLEAIPIKNWWTEILWKNIKGYKLSFVLVWRNAVNLPNHYYVPYPGQASADNFRKFEKIPQVLFRKDLKDLYK